MRTQKNHVTNPRQLRHEAITRVIRARAVHTQEELAELLGKEGFDVTQTTLSRDLAEIGAIRAPRPSGQGGGAVYEIRDQLSNSGGGEARAASRLLRSIRKNESLVVVSTQPGGAPAIARVIDLARMDQALGCIAGDDTIFVAPAAKVSAHKLLDALCALFEVEKNQKDEKGDWFR
jgi:transcriptional regulator of arginine metabolism